MRKEKIKNFDLIIRYKIFRQFFLKNNHENIILATTTKTGTHYLRLCLAYYICKLYKLNYEIDETIIDKIFPNSWHSSYTFKSKLNHTPLMSIRELSFSDIPRSHMPFNHAWANHKVIHTFRNPLDQCVISFFTKFNLMNNCPYKNPYDLFLKTYKYLIEEYESFKFKVTENSNVRRISFESLINNPYSNLEPLLNFLNLGFNKKLIYESVNFANKFPIAYIGAFEKWHRPNFISQKDKTLINDFISQLPTKNNLPKSTDSYKIFFKTSEINQAKEILKENSRCFYNLYF